jgi:hypothetical protein
LSRISKSTKRKQILIVKKLSMDRIEMKKILEPFKAKCTDKGKHLTDLFIEEAFPGDSSTSFIVRVKAPWIQGMYCY